MKRTCACVSFVLMAGISCHGDRSYSPDPSALFQDGNHDNGNAFFFWLPPLVQQQAPAAQVFSNQLSPIVTVTNLCTGSAIREFTGSQVQIGPAAYQADWTTADDGLDPACTYRITTTTGARQLGVIDVAVVNDGRELKNVDTGELIALLDDGTLPIQFFIGVGSQCARADSDCGEGVAQPGSSTTIVTTHGQAGVFIPAGAVDNPVTIIIESADERPCIAGLLAPVFSGAVGSSSNACYDINTEPPLSAINASGKFNTKVTVGICAQTGNLDHATRDLLQIFQLHLGTILALTNVRAPFLACDPSSPQFLGSHRSRWENLASRFGALVMPRPLFASTTTALDLGTGGETDIFSRFTWALPSVLDFDFDRAPDLTSILPGALVNSVYTRVGVTFSRTRLLTLLCPGSGVYANDYGLLLTGLLGFGSGQNNISVCPLGIASDFSEHVHGAIKATFTIPAVEACITARPTGYRSLFLFSGGVAFLEARDANGNVVNRTESTSQRVPQRLCVRGTSIASVRFAGKGSAYAIFDNLRWTRVLPVN